MPLPKPFSRPSIDLSSTEKKDWQEVPVRSLTTGTVVRGWGLIVEIDDYPEETVVVWKNGTRSIFSKSDIVTAFVTVKE